MKQRFAVTVPALLGHEVEMAEVHQNRVCLVLAGGGGRTEHLADHVIAATGYEVDLRRLTFLSGEVRSGIRTMGHAPVLSPYFETSFPGLYIVGFASKYCFGPVMQFACGAEWTARRISRRLADAGRRNRRPQPAVSDDVVSTSAAEGGDRP